MSADEQAKYRRVQFLDEARDDLRAVAARSQTVLLEVLRQLKRLDSRLLEPIPLHDYGKTGDLRDCGKIVIALPGEPEYRIVVRDLGDVIDVVEVIAVEDRVQDLPYLLAGVRLGRIHDPVRRSDAGRRIFRIRQRLDNPRG